MDEPKSMIGPYPTPRPVGDEEPARAFVVVRENDSTAILDLPLGVEVRLGSSDRAGVRVGSGGEDFGILRWNGRRLRLEPGPDSLFLHGKIVEAGMELTPGMELTTGNAELVFGIAAPTHGVRRTLGHQEFRERLYEELARATRSGRPTAVGMVRCHSEDEADVIARACLQTFRAGDVVAEYAPGELELLLPDTGAETALLVIERAIASTELDATAGVAVAPINGDNPERLLRAARSALARARDVDGRPVSIPPPRETPRLEPVAHDPTTKRLLDAIDRLASTRSAVLFVGEISSGKGAFARWLHERRGGARSDLSVLQCATLVHERAAAKLFEQEPAFYGKKTIMFDEICELPSEVQTRVRELLDRRPDLCIFATTHRSLPDLVDRELFDRALYERIAESVLHVPALRQRPGDILPLATHFADELGAKRPVRFSPGALARMHGYPWPGNVLELRNAIERAVRLARGGEIQADHLPSEALPFTPQERRLRDHVDRIERDAIVSALADTNQNQTRAAKQLGISRRALIYKMEKYGLKPPPGAARKASSEGPPRSE